MKLFFLILLIVVTYAKPPNSHSKDKFRDFKNKFNKRYENSTEENKRLEKFAENLDFIEKHNQRKDVTFKLALTQDADMDINEFIRLRSGLRYPNEENKARRGGGGNRKPAKYVPNQKTNPPAPVTPAPVTPAPVPSGDYVDWRTKGYVTPIKNQGDCGSCWAFAANGALEGQWYKKYGVLPDLSEQNLIDCSSSWGNAGCGGGLMHYAFNYIKDNNGIDSTSSYPYAGWAQSCKFSSYYVSAKVTGYYQLPENDEVALENAVRNIGPVAVGFYINANFSYYSSGVLSANACSSTSINHALLIVGFNNEANPKYWIAKNSWGTGWGNKGYIHIEKGKNTCNIAKYSLYPYV